MIIGKRKQNFISMKIEILHPLNSLFKQNKIKAKSNANVNISNCRPNLGSKTTIWSRTLLFKIFSRFFLFFYRLFSLFIVLFGYLVRLFHANINPSLASNMAIVDFGRHFYIHKFLRQRFIFSSLLHEWEFSSSLLCCYFALISLQRVIKVGF